MIRLLKDFFALAFLITAIVVLFVCLQTNYIWGDVYIDQILINMEDGLSNVSNKIVIGYIISIILGVVTSVALSIVFKKNRYLVFISVASFLFVFFKIGLFSYYLNKTTYSNIYEEEFVSLENKDFTYLSGKRNLIVAYIESAEENYATSANENLIKHTYARMKSNLSFEGYYPLKYQDYTIAAMVESMCAVPYKKSVLKGYDAYQNFLSSLKCYPEILQKDGYETVFMKGADIEFARTGLFMETHGFNEVMGAAEINRAFDMPLKDNKGGFGGYHDGNRPDQ